MLFTRKNNFTSKTYEYIIVGLGNPGKKYEFTRHNAGFLFVDILCDKYDFSVKRLKFKALIGDAKIGGHRCLVMKPQTMMNLSGDAVKEAADFLRAADSEQFPRTSAAFSKTESCAFAEDFSVKCSA